MAVFGRAIQAVFGGVISSVADQEVQSVERTWNEKLAWSSIDGSATRFGPKYSNYQIHARYFAGVLYYLVERSRAGFVFLLDRNIARNTRYKSPDSRFCRST